VTETTGAQIGMPPRWEWRIFAASLAEVEAKVGRLAQVSPHHSQELYLVNGRSPHNAKIRDGLLDVKRIKMTAATGLELWEATLKRGFPMSAPTIASFFAALDLAPPILRRQIYSMEEFLAEVIRSDSAFRTVKVTKARRVFSLRESRAELARLSIGGAKQETFCIEDESAERVEAALKELCLDPAANTNYPKFFETLASLRT
jgi:exopolyphosphatase / guanosine-5'-triphosphate,3'-diphosphate pyrophosphatase